MKEYFLERIKFVENFKLCGEISKNPNSPHCKVVKSASNYPLKIKLIITNLFRRLREVVPKLDVDYKLSKFETLQMAQTYIQAMCEMLDRGTDENTYTLFDSSENNNCRKTLDNNKNEV